MKHAPADAEGPASRKWQRAARSLERLGTKIIPRLRSGTAIRIGVNFSVTVSFDVAGAIIAELQQTVRDLELGEVLRVE